MRGCRIPMRQLTADTWCRTHHLSSDKACKVRCMARQRSALSIKIAESNSTETTTVSLSLSLSVFFGTAVKHVHCDLLLWETSLLSLLIIHSLLVLVNFRRIHPSFRKAFDAVLPHSDSSLQTFCLPSVLLCHVSERPSGGSKGRQGGLYPCRLRLDPHFPHLNFTHRDKIELITVLWDEYPQ